MKPILVFTVTALALFLALNPVSANACDDLGRVSTPSACYAEDCYSSWSDIYWIPFAGFFADPYECHPCFNQMRCADYSLEEDCAADPCDILNSDTCTWDDSGLVGNCVSPCSKVTPTPSYLESKMIDCTNRQCYYLQEGFFSTKYVCRDCKPNLRCSDYKKQYQCEGNSTHKGNPCDVIGVCTWKSSDKVCLEDNDGDGFPAGEDNCPNINNNQSNTYCHKDYSSNPAGVRDDPGDACDDMDADGVTDQDEMELGLNPLDTDSDDNCINDGVEYMFQPIINILTKMAIAVATVMLMFLGLKWVTAEESSARANAKAGIVYVLVGLILLIGGKNLVVFILQMKCDPAETPQLTLNVDYWLCTVLLPVSLKGLKSRRNEINALKYTLWRPIK